MNSISIEISLTEEAKSFAVEHELQNQSFSFPSNAPMPAVGDEVALFAGKKFVAFKVVGRRFYLHQETPKLNLVLGRLNQQ